MNTPLKTSDFIGKIGLKNKLFRKYCKGNGNLQICNHQVSINFFVSIGDKPQAKICRKCGVIVSCLNQEQQFLTKLIF